METIKKFIEWLQNLPIWLRVVIVIACAAVCFGLSFVSCSTVKVVGNTADSHVTVRQSALDSTKITIDVLPYYKANRNQ
ncbi:hypothetical protein [Capybara microvirus Cap3_SP_332]|nr:hypothetical protein [Capybara microvirus Cap3_SP_332]